MRRVLAPGPTTSGTCAKLQDPWQMPFRLQCLASDGGEFPLFDTFFVSSRIFCGAALWHGAQAVVGPAIRTLDQELPRALQQSQRSCRSCSVTQTLGADWCTQDLQALWSLGDILVYPSCNLMPAASLANTSLSNMYRGTTRSGAQSRYTSSRKAHKCSPGAKDVASTSS